MSNNSCFIQFKNKDSDICDFKELIDIACLELQTHLKTQNEWLHNFGLNPSQTGMVIGKMFGILIVKNMKNELGYLSAFSGKLAGANHHKRFVPPIFDMLSEESFFLDESIVINELNSQIDHLKSEQKKEPHLSDKITLLKKSRKEKSSSLQKKLFGEYLFLNSKGEKKDLLTVFADASAGSPPAGSGECTAPKLFQYAFKNNLKPLAITEFWWGASPKAEERKHQKHYPSCKAKCEPILKYMLDGLNIMTYMCKDRCNG